MKYHAVAQSSEIAPGAMKSVTVKGEQILLANIDGAFHAIAQKCPHMGADLCQGTLAGNIVTCPKHGASFDLKTGKTVEKPKLLFLRFRTNDATTFPVKLKGKTVLVRL